MVQKIRWHIKMCVLTPSCLVKFPKGKPENPQNDRYKMHNILFLFLVVIKSLKSQCVFGFIPCSTFLLVVIKSFQLVSASPEKSAVVQKISVSARPGASLIIHAVVSLCWLISLAFKVFSKELEVHKEKYVQNASLV